MCSKASVTALKSWVYIFRYTISVIESPLLTVIIIRSTIISVHEYDVKMDYDSKLVLRNKPPPYDKT